MTEYAQTYQPQIGDMFKTHEEFVSKIKNYARELGFIIRLGKVEYLNTSKNRNSKELSEEQETTTQKMVRKRTLLCSRAGYSEHNPEDNPKRN